MKLNTHLEIDSTLCGKIVELKENYAKVELTTTDIMKADNKGLVHGGFTFSSADFTAMASINNPNVVLTASDVKFLAPVKVGDKVIFEGNVIEQDNKKSKVEVVGKVNEKEVLKGIFKTYTLDKHILT